MRVSALLSITRLGDVASVYTNPALHPESRNQYESLWKALPPEARTTVKKSNHDRLFDTARQWVRAWEAANLGTKTSQ